MREGISYVPRRASAMVEEALQDTRVVVINGARQVGKSTLADRVLHNAPTGVSKFLDHPQTREAAESDPVGFARHDGLMLIDEVQRVPDLWLTVKYLVDRDPRPGQFILTGSARLLDLRSIPDSLIGRAETIELWPMSQGEIDGAPDGFVDAAFAYGADLVRKTQPLEVPLRPADYRKRLERGGLPTAVARNRPRRRAEFFERYLSDLMTRDVVQVAQIERPRQMGELMSVLAGQPAGMLNIDRLAATAGLPRTTVSSYVSLLETVYLIQRIPAWSSGATRRSVGMPKLMFVDSGMANHLANGARHTDQVAGGLMENFVLGELCRQMTWSETWAHIYHYRDRDKHEVDAVIEENGGRIVGVEVKAAETVRSSDFQGLRYLQRRLGDRFHAGFVLYCGDQAESFGDGMGCLPISALWTTPAPDAE